MNTEPKCRKLFSLYVFTCLMMMCLCDVVLLLGIVCMVILPIYRFLSRLCVHIQPSIYLFHFRIYYTFHFSLLKVQWKLIFDEKNNNTTLDLQSNSIHYILHHLSWKYKSIWNNNIICGSKKMHIVIYMLLLNWIK